MFDLENPSREGKAPAVRVKNEPSLRLQHLSLSNDKKVIIRDGYIRGHYIARKTLSVAEKQVKRLALLKSISVQARCDIEDLHLFYQR